MLCDYHLHTEYSDDSSYPMESLIQDAISLGLNEICITDHVDMIARYDLAGAYPFENIKDMLTEILKIVIQDGKGIEVNTSSHRYRLPDLPPSRDILKLYRELGGTIVTIGSDAHKKEDVGEYIEYTQQELRKLGFEQFCTFEKMKPVFHDLI